MSACGSPSLSRLGLITFLSVNMASGAHKNGLFQSHILFSAKKLIIFNRCLSSALDRPSSPSTSDDPDTPLPLNLNHHARYQSTQRLRSSSRVNDRGFWVGHVCNVVRAGP